MQIPWNVVIWSGLVATTIFASFFWVARSFNLTTFSPTVQLGCLFSREPRSPTTEAIGFVLLFALGSTLVPAVYFALLLRYGALSAAGGVLLGGLHGLLFLALLPLAGTISACVRAGHLPRPGHFGLRWGGLTMGVVLLGHLLYGATLGATLAAFMTEGSAAPL